MADQYNDPNLSETPEVATVPRHAIDSEFDKTNIELHEIPKPEPVHDPEQTWVNQNPYEMADLDMEIPDYIECVPSSYADFLEMYQPREESEKEGDQSLSAVDAGEKKTGRMTNKERADFEAKMKDTLDRGDLDEITDMITVYNLTKCKTNSLEKSLEVSCKLRSLSMKNGPDAEDFLSLSNSVEDFAVQLIEPLKSNEMQRATFEGDDFNRIKEKIVLFRQKKVVSHPVVYNLLMRLWTGAFSHLRFSKWTEINAFKWMFLNVWTIFDVVLFPFVFAVLFLVRKIAVFVKKRQDHAVVLILNATQKKLEKNMHELANDVIDNFGNCRTQYASLIRKTDGLVINEMMGKLEAKSAINEGMIKTAKDSFTSCLQNARKKLTKCSGHCQNKTVVIMTDDKSGDQRSSIREAQKIKHEGFRVICVCIGVCPDIKELEAMATDDHVLLYFGDVRKVDVVEKVIKGMHGYGIYDRYVQYFNTPYFIFVRDTLSYLALLGLHFALCLQPSTLHFTSLEWVIMLFFIGRLLMEIDQAIVEKQLGEKNPITTHSEKGRQNTKHLEREQSETNKEQSKEGSKTICQVFLGMMSRYFSDWWNALDLITLLVYIIILILRSITWADHITVSNNRLLAVAGYLYGLNTMFLTLRVFGHIMESKKKTGSIQIALFQIIGAVVAIFGQFLAATLAFSLALTKVYVSEMSYTAGDNSTSHGFCENRNGGIECWWGSATHLIWSLLGIADLGPLQSTDRPSDVIAQLLYGIFLIMAVVMLMNMMIALLSNTYQNVEDNAFYEWSYRKATTIRTYSKYHPVPVPFNIISLIFLCIRYIYKNIASKGKSQDEGNKDKPVEGQDDSLKDSLVEGQDDSLKDSLVEGQDDSLKDSSFFDHLVYDLQAIYFSAYAYAFPMAESDKMNLLLKETEGSHQLIGHIANQVYKYNKRDARQLANEMENQSVVWDTAGIEVNGHQLNYVPCTCPKCKKLPDDLPTKHGAQYQFPLTKIWPGFEVLLQETGDRHFIAIGVVQFGHNNHMFPGWEGDTAGFHVDDGKIFDKQNHKSGKECEGAMAKRGDLIGCKIEFEKSNDGTIPVSFTLNGRVIGDAKVKQGKEFYPFIGIGRKGITLLFKLRSCHPEETFRKSQSDEMMTIILETNSRVGKLERMCARISKHLNIE